MANKRTMPVRTADIKLDGDWDGWEFTVRKSVPFGQLIDGLTTLERADGRKSDKVIEAIYTLLQLLVVKWNYVDEKGNVLTVDRAGFATCPYDLLMLTIRKAQEAVTQIPLSEGENSPNGYSATEDLDDPIPAT